MVRLSGSWRQHLVAGPSGRSISAPAGRPAASVPRQQQVAAALAALAAPPPPPHHHHQRRRPTAQSPRRHVCACTADGDAAPTTTPPTPTPQTPPPITISLAASLVQLRQVARLRAEAYYEDDRGRFAESFKRQFAAQEEQSLLVRTSPTPGTGATAPPVECLAAADVASGDVVGCIDVRLPRAVSGARVTGVPAEETRAAYILNVVVDERARGLGVGRVLMRAAMARAVRAWGAADLYTRVEADNEVALALYLGCGFEEHNLEEARHEAASALGRLLLLKAPAAVVTWERMEADAAAGGSVAAAAGASSAA